MKYSIDKQERYSILTLNEHHLNSSIAPDLKSSLVILQNEGVNNLIMDLSNVQYIDSSGLSALLTADRVMKANGSFVITGINHPSVKKLIEISRLDSVMTLIPTLQEAIEYVFMEELQREIEEGEDEA